MKELVESLSLWSGAFLVAIVSGALVWILAAAFPRLRRLWAVVVPLVIASCLYWSPVWLGSDPSEYGAWVFVVIPPWFLAGVIASVTVIRIFPKPRSR